MVLQEIVSNQNCVLVMCTHPGKSSALSDLKSSDIKSKVHGQTYTYAGTVDFSIPELYQLAETHDIHYVIRLKANNILKQKAQNFEDELWKRLDLNTTETKVFYKSFDYKAHAWDKPRRAVVKMEKPEGELFFGR